MLDIPYKEVFGVYQDMGMRSFFLEQTPSEAILALADSFDLFGIKKSDLSDCIDEIFLTLELFACFFHGNPSKFISFLLGPYPEGYEVLGYIYVGIIDDILFVLNKG